MSLLASTSVYICPEACRVDNLSTALHELAQASPAASLYQVTVLLTGQQSFSSPRSSAEILDCVVSILRIVFRHV